MYIVSVCVCVCAMRKWGGVGGNEEYRLAVGYHLRLCEMKNFVYGYREDTGMRITQTRMG